MAPTRIKPISPDATRSAGPAKAIAPPSSRRCSEPLPSADLAGVQIAVLASLAEAEPVWRRAEAQSPGWIFQCFDWHAAWQATIGAAERVVPQIVHVAAADGETLLLLPLAIHRYRGLRIVKFHGDLVTDYNAPLIGDGRLGAEHVASLWGRILGRLMPHDLVWLRRITDDIDGARNPLLGLPGIEQNEEASAARLPPTMAEFRKTHTLDWADTRRRRRRL